MHRCSPVLLLLRGVDALKVYLPFMLLQGSIAERLPSALLVPWYALVAYYTVSRFHLIFFDWLTVRYSWSVEGIVHRSGWPTSVTTRARWSEVGALHVEQDLAHQLLRRFRVRAVLGADGREGIELEALDAATVAALRAFHDAAHPETTEHSAGMQPSQQALAAHAQAPLIAPGPTDQLIFRAGWRDYLLISVGYGQFVLVVPFLLGAWSDIAARVGLPDGTVVLDQLLAAGPTVMLASVPVAFAFGFTRAWVTFAGYRVTRDASGFEARGGLLRRDVRRACFDEVRGVRISQNPLLRLVGRYSVSLVLGSARGEFRSLVVLPVASATSVHRLMLDMVPESETPRRPATTVPWGVFAAVLAAGVVGTVATSLAQLAWVAIGVGLIAGLVADALYVRVELPGTGIVLSHRRGTLWRRQYLVTLGSVRRVESWRRALPGFLGRCWARIVVMDRRPVSLWLPAVPSALVDQVAARIVQPRQQEVGL